MIAPLLVTALRDARHATDSVTGTRALRERLAVLERAVATSGVEPAPADELARRQRVVQRAMIEMMD